MKGDLVLLAVCILTGCGIGVLGRLVIPGPPTGFSSDESSFRMLSDSTISSEKDVNLMAYSEGNTPFEKQCAMLDYLVRERGKWNGRTSYAGDPFSHALFIALLAGVDRDQALTRISKDQASDFIATDLIFREWAHADPQKAYGVAETLSVVGIRTRALEAVAVETIHSDRDLAIQILEIYHVLFRSFSIIALANEAPKDICTLLERLPVGALRPADTIAPKRWAETDPNAAWNWASSRFGLDSQCAVVKVLAASNPRAVDALVNEPSISSRNKRHFMNILIGELAKTDPDEALRLALDGRNSDQMANSMEALATGLLANGRDFAWNFAESRQEKSEREAITRSLLGKIAVESLEEAINWFETQPSEEMKAIGLEAFGREWAKADPQTVSAFLTEIPHTHNPQTSRIVIESLMDISPSNAADWAQNLPLDAQTDALGMIISRWSNQEVELAAEYFGESEYIPISEGSVKNLVRNYYNKDRDAAIHWVENIKSESFREFAKGFLDLIIERSHVETSR